MPLATLAALAAAQTLSRLPAPEAGIRRQTPEAIEMQLPAGEAQ